jgi:hypothetical protein
MPALEDALHKELDLFQKPERDSEPVSDHAPAKVETRVEMAQQRRDVEHTTAQEAVAPHIVAQLPQKTEASDEAVQRLFDHFAERTASIEGAVDQRQKLDDDTRERTVAQPDARTQGKSTPARGVDVDDEVKDGSAADFLADSARAAGDRDVPAVVEDGFDDSTSPRRRRRARTSARVGSKKSEGKK